MGAAGAERAAANMPIQGTEADLMKMAMLAVEKRLDFEQSQEKNKKHNVIARDSYLMPLDSGLLGQQILQVHDSILVECPHENADTVGELLRDTMETIYPELKIKLKVDVSVGKNWGEV